MEATAKKATFQKYPAYKDSGSDWSGQIPVDWESLPIRAIFEERNEKNDGPKTDFILSVTKDRGVIPYDEKGQIGNNKSEDIERYKVVYPNDFVINKMNVIIGSLGMSKYFGAFSQVYLVYKPKSSRINIEYYSYIFSNPSFYKSLIRFCTGIMELRESLNKNDFKKIILPFPDFNTQTAIVRFLNDKTAKIDRAIAQKEKMIALLKERKQIIIQNAVTKGLDPNAKMKDSGVEWIGEIPEGWEVKRLKFLLNELNIRSETGAEELLSLSKYSGVIPKSSLEERAGGAESLIGYKIVKENHLVINKMQAVNGLIAVAKISGITSPDYSVYFVKDESVLNIDYLCQLILQPQYLAEFKRRVTGVMEGFIRLYTDDLYDVTISLPPIQEQTAIVSHIGTQSAKIDKAIKLQEQQIEKLKELKSTLIDSAVTGKIKVS